LPELIGVPSMVYPIVAVGLLIVFGLPRITTAVPAPLVAVVALTIVTALAGIRVATVHDKGELPNSLPGFFLPNVPLTWATFQTIAPFALSMALVGLLESLLTAFLGGLGGCAVIGQTMINVKGSGARSRLSTFLAGAFLLVLVVALGDVVAYPTTMPR
jgi:SulP family sulfate permease